MTKVSLERFEEIINNCTSKKVAVIGDVMLDRYFWGNVSRVSPEAPVPVVHIENETFHLGGAANVANNLFSLGIKPILCGVVGDDNTGNMFRSVSNKIGISTEGLYVDLNRPTTVKTRIIGNNQQIARLDREIRKNISYNATQHIENTIDNIEDLSGIIFEDYNKGVISKELIVNILEISKKNNIPVFVDPKFDNFFEYKDVTVFKPNRKEAKTALNVHIENIDDAMYAANLIFQKINCKYILLTLGSEGMLLLDYEGNSEHIPTIARKVADVSGAGDTAIATLAASISGGANIYEATLLSNYALGAVCELPGIVSITKEMLIKSILKNSF